MAARMSRKAPRSLRAELAVVVATFDVLAVRLQRGIVTGRLLDRSL